MTDANVDPHDPVLALRDPEFIRGALPWLTGFLKNYHETSVSGLSHLPDGAALIVGNHNGGTMSPDMYALMTAFWTRYGADAPSYGLAHDAGFRVPIVRTMISKMGAVPARPHHAQTLLARGAKVLVYPGGDIDAFRSSSKRREVVFGDRVGFIRVALKAGVPIVPVVAAGAHESFHVITDGVEFARKSGWKRLTRIEVFPLILSFPFGLSVGPFAVYFPLPVRMKIRVLPPIYFDGLGPDDADNRDVLIRCQRKVHGVMQEALDDLYDEGEVGLRFP